MEAIRNFYRDVSPVNKRFNLIWGALWVLITLGFAISDFARGSYGFGIFQLFMVLVFTGFLTVGIAQVRKYGW